jgi:hypothetical protein
MSAVSSISGNTSPIKIIWAVASQVSLAIRSYVTRFLPAVLGGSTHRAPGQVVVIGLPHVAASLQLQGVLPAAPRVRSCVVVARLTSAHEPGVENVKPAEMFPIGNLGGRFLHRNIFLIHASPHDR